MCAVQTEAGTGLTEHVPKPSLRPVCKILLILCRPLKYYNNNRHLLNVDQLPLPSRDECGTRFC
jgi:hypothetical protein